MCASDGITLVLAVPVQVCSTTASAHLDQSSAMLVHQFSEASGHGVHATLHDVAADVVPPCITYVHIYIHTYIYKHRHMSIIHTSMRHVHVAGSIRSTTA